MIKVAIVDDNVRLCKALKSELLQFREIESVYCCHSGVKFMVELANMIQPKRPDVVIMDVSMTTHDEGIKITAQIKAKFPALPVIVFTVSDDDEKIFEAFKAGALGYLLKDEKPEFIVKTILDVMSGGVQMSPGIAKKAINFFIHAPASAAAPVSSETHNPLSDREMEILLYVSKGHTYTEIADLLFISNGTVKKHMANIFLKLHVKNKVSALQEIKKLS
ncbi:MAG: response regulator transcription factor [Bacteroidetes bacterium]|nr:response regulator transcription factor [Bacteroidota bacterium]MBS1539983.1 response regulator transcription factor [Bacteroidota bacterium]